MLVVCVGRVAAVVCWLRPKGSDPCVLKVWHCNSTVDSVVSTMLCGIELYPFVLRVVQHVVAIWLMHQRSHHLSVWLDRLLWDASEHVGHPVESVCKESAWSGKAWPLPLVMMPHLGAAPFQDETVTHDLQAF